ncbi:MAG: discoidin domain-containing protein, partial [Verrucomicrobia bacterium]|nr:discoidin domain-containing protein [Verrucomicrobiota bacterium]
MQSQLDSMRKKLEIPIVEQTSGRIGYHSAYSNKSEKNQWLQLDLGQSVTPDSIILVPAFVNYGSDPQPGYGFPQRFRIEISDDPEFATSSIIADESQANYQLKHNPFYHASGKGHRGRYVRITASQLGVATTSPDAQRRYAFALGEVMILEGNLNRAITSRASASTNTNVPPAWHINNAIDGQTYLGLPQWKESSPQNGFHSHIFTDGPNQDEWVEVDLGSEMPLTEIRLIPARPVDYPESSGFGFPIDFKVQIGSDREFFKDVFSATNFPNPGAQVVTIPLPPGSRGRYIRAATSRLRERSGDYIFALAELQVFSEDVNIALGKTVTSSSMAEGATSWSREALVDGFSSRHQLLDWPQWIDTLLGIAELRDQMGQQQVGIEQLVKRRRKRTITTILFVMTVIILR